MSPAVAPPTWAVVLVAGVVSYLVASAWRRYAVRRQLLDAPGPRRLHQHPTPRGGGIGIALVLLAGAPWLGQGALAFAAGLALTAGAGLLDDLRELRALPKLALQILGALPVAWAWPLAPELLGAAAGAAGSLLLVLMLVNFWNFMDGSNGLAATQALLVGLGIALSCGPGSPVGLLGLVLAVACLGFLPLNLPQARLFLGDVGSHALGFSIAALSLAALERGQAGPWPLLMLMSAMVLDAGLTLSGRIRRRQKVWRAHREHLYQRAVAHGWSHARVCAAYAAWTLLALSLAIGTPRSLQPMVALAWFGLGAALYLWAGQRWPRPDNVLESVA